MGTSSRSTIFRVRAPASSDSSSQTGQVAFSGAGAPIGVGAGRWGGMWWDRRTVRAPAVLRAALGLDTLGSCETPAGSTGCVVRGPRNARRTAPGTPPATLASTRGSGRHHPRARPLCSQGGPLCPGVALRAPGVGPSPSGPLAGCGFLPGPTVLRPTCPPAGSGARGDFLPSGVSPRLLAGELRRPPCSACIPRPEPPTWQPEPCRGGPCDVTGCPRFLRPRSREACRRRCSQLLTWTGRHGAEQMGRQRILCSHPRPVWTFAAAPWLGPVSADPFSAAVRHCSWASLSCPSEPSGRPCSADPAVPGATGAARGGIFLQHGLQGPSRPPGATLGRHRVQPAGG